MSYNDLIKVEGCEGIHEYSQGTKSEEGEYYIDKGICHGLVLVWLDSKRNEKKNFFKKLEDDKKGIKKPLLNREKAFLKGADLQEIMDREGSDHDFDHTWLHKKNLEYHKEDSLTEKSGFCNLTKVGHENERIAERVLTKGSRFFILEIWTENNGHSIGIFRPWTTFGKSKSLHLLL